VLGDPQEQVHGPGIGFPHSAQNLPVLDDPQAQTHAEEAAGETAAEGEAGAKP
jgi:hypothetical protein